jgi:hypothetical protein
MVASAKDRTLRSSALEISLRLWKSICRPSRGHWVARNSSRYYSFHIHRILCRLEWVCRSNEVRGKVGLWVYDGRSFLTINLIILAVARWLGWPVPGWVSRQVVKFCFLKCRLVRLHA